LAAPGAPALTAGDSRIDAAWTAVSGASAYEVWYGTTAATETKLASNPAGTSVSILGLANGTPYYVRLKAKNAAETSAFGPAAQAAPIPAKTAPAVLSAAPTLLAGDGSITVTWNHVPGAAGYAVYYGRVNSADNVTLWAENIQAAATVITGLTNDLTYWVFVQARNSAGTGPLSAGAGAVPGAVAPAAPAAPTLVPDDKRLNVSWASVPRAASYEVWYGTTAATGTKLASDPSGTSAFITGLANGTTYHVRLKAKNAVGVSAFGPAASAAPYMPANAGTAAITVTAPPEFGPDPFNLAQSGAVTLSKTGTGGHPASAEFTLQNTGSLSDPAYCWVFDGAETGTGTSLTINAAARETGAHYLSVEIRAGTGAWSNEIQVLIVE
jgi:titin